MIGIFIAYISARFKYKNLAAIILGMIFFIAIMYFSMTASEIDADVFTEMNDMMISMVVGMYPPAMLFAREWKEMLQRMLALLRFQLLLLLLLSSLLQSILKKSQQ